jgi:hypothetical protein
MSVVLTAQFAGEALDVEVFHDGAIAFPGRDFRYEQATAEFGFPETPAVQLHRFWTIYPINVIFDHFWQIDINSWLLTADYAEHVLHFYEDEYPEDSRPRSLVAAIRSHAALEADSKEFTQALIENMAYDVWNRAWHSWRSMQRQALTAHALTAHAYRLRPAVEAARAVRAAAAWSSRANAAGVAADTVAYSISLDPDSPEWRVARDSETAWQVRRFVDVMEAIGQGLPWPPMGATP